MFDSNIDVYTTEFICAEVAEYVPYFYKEGMGKAKKLMKVPEDSDVAALALEIDAPVWSNDNHFKDFPTGRYTTAQLLKRLGK